MKLLALTNWFTPRHSSQPISVPVFLEKVPAGFPSPSESYEDGSISLDEYLIRHPDATIMIRAGGDSMHDAGIDKNDLLIVDRSLAPRHMDIVLADIGHEFTIKRLHLNGSMSLHPENEATKYPVIQPVDGVEWVIVGVVTSMIKQFRS